MPLLPLPPTQRPWSISVNDAYHRLSHIFETTSSYLDSHNFERHRLQQYGDAIISDAYPILLLMADSAQSEFLPEIWIESAADQFTELLRHVNDHWKSLDTERYGGDNYGQYLRS